MTLALLGRLGERWLARLRRQVWSGERRNPVLRPGRDLWSPGRGHGRECVTTPSAARDRRGRHVSHQVADTSRRRSRYADLGGYTCGGPVPWGPHPHGAGDFARPARPMTRISVIKDDPDILETMSDILDWLEGHDVAGFEGSETTFEQLIESRPELLIVDLRIAGDKMDGWEIVKRARSTPELRDVPLIVCSADVINLRDRSAELARLGNVHTLEMPFSIEDFEAVIERALDGAAPSERQPSPPPN